MSKASVKGRGITSGRYIEASDGKIFDTWGGYYIGRDYWDERLAEGRSDTARHDFRYVDTPPELRSGWYQHHVECRRCGEHRKISVSLDQLNRQERWCIRPSTLGISVSDEASLLIGCLIGTIAVIVLALWLA